MKEVLRMTFEDERGNKTSLSVDEPKTDITDIEVSSAMDRILDLGILMGKEGPLLKKTKAVIQASEIRELNID